MSIPKHRADIDGIRALAVLAVVGFHAFHIRGGFLGVDVFFVISGFLISTIILESLDRGTFSFGEFYGRRVRRIFPALLFVLTAAFLFGWVTLLSHELKQLGGHIAGGAGFLSNFLLWRESGYFDNAGETKPLLHLWSLSIEEQFYLLWPLVLWLAWRWRWNALFVMATLAVASFLLNLYGISHDPVAAFYSPQTRFWEILAGSILAYFSLYKKSTMSKLQACNGNLAALAGVLLLLLARAYVRPESFPGWLALFPVLGTALIIAAGPGAWLNRTVLSHPALVWFGLISFPLYLWHWPILSFLRILVAGNPERLLRCAAVAVSILLAWLTYRFIEHPIRFGGARRGAPQVLTVFMFLLGTAGLVAHLKEGWGFRAAANPKEVKSGDIEHEFFQKYLVENFKPCNPPEVRAAALVNRCFQSKSGPVDIAIIGDSHAEHLFTGLAEKLKNKNVAYYIRTTVPILANREFDPIFHYLLRSQSVQAVLIGAYWKSRLQTDALPEGSNLLVELQKTVDAFAQSRKRIYVADDTPNFSFDPKRCKFSGGYLKPNTCRQEATYYQRQLASYRPMLEPLENGRSWVKVMRTSSYLCDEAFCHMSIGEELLYRDYNHLNLNGSRYIAQRILADHPELAR